MNPELIILESLQSSYPRGLRENILNSDMRVAGNAMSLSDQERHCRNLNSKKQITIIKGEDYTLITITPDGLARLSA
jgi:hypothetical protein